jgi:AdoMet-dependent rRNA methyltransferase SPB1
MVILNEADARKDQASGFGSGDTDEESDDEQDKLDRELDSMYELYQERKSDTDAKFRAKKARKEHGDGEWEGFSAGEQGSDDDDELEQDSSDESSDEEMPSKRSLLTDLDRNEKMSGGLSRRAAQFFDQEIFKDIGGLPEEEESDEAVEDDEEIAADLDQLDSIIQHDEDGESENDRLDGGKEAESESDDDEKGFEVVKRTDAEKEWEDEAPRKDGKLGKHHNILLKLYNQQSTDIDIITAEAMTLAQQIASGERRTRDLIDEGFNKYAFKDRDGLPEWFLDDEHRHDKPHRPITAAGAAAIKEKLRALNARPIKKVREAKDRKKFKAAQRLEKLRKKSAMLQDEEGMTEKEKAQSIMKLMSKAGKKKPKQQVKVVVARGGNRGIAGRPRGVKGKYKIVDARLKKDTRAEKRAAKKRK